MGAYKIDKDLSEAQKMAEALDEYVRGTELYGSASGGFFGSYGKGAIYFTKQEISWAVKFFIDAELLAAASRVSSV